MTKPRITICICTYDRYDLLPKAIASAQGQSLARSTYRILVIDNSPDHGQAAVFGSRYHALPLFEYRVEKTPGLANARNVGARECGTEFIAYLDDDAIASAEWLGNLLHGFDDFGTEVDIVGGRVDPIWESPRPDWLGDQLLSFVSAVDWGGDIRLAKADEWFAGTNIAFRTTAIIVAGGFDTRLGRVGAGATLLSNEETVLMRHLRSQGKLAVYVPQASVRHLVERRRITQAWFRKRASWQAVSDFIADPDGSHRAALRGWDIAMSYFFELPPRERTIRGLHFDTDSPALFKRQLDVLWHYTVMSLSGFDGVARIEQSDPAA